MCPCSRRQMATPLVPINDLLRAPRRNIAEDSKAHRLGNCSRRRTVLTMYDARDIRTERVLEAFDVGNVLYDGG